MQQQVLLQQRMMGTGPSTGTNPNNGSGGGGGFGGGMMGRGPGMMAGRNGMGGGAPVSLAMQMAMQAQVRAKAAAATKALTKEEGVRRFKELLLDKGVTPFSLWERELPKLEADERCGWVHVSSCSNNTSSSMCGDALDGCHHSGRHTGCRDLEESMARNQT